MLRLAYKSHELLSSAMLLQTLGAEDHLVLLPQHLFCRGSATADKLLLLFPGCDMVSFATAVPVNIIVLS